MENEKEKYLNEIVWGLHMRPHITFKQSLTFDFKLN